MYYEEDILKELETKGFKRD